MEHGRGIQSPVAARQLKGLKRVTRTAVFRVSEHDCLSRDAEEAIFQHAVVLSEGVQSGDRFSGSSMISVDLNRLAHLFREPLDRAGLDRLRRSMEKSVRVHLRAIRIARNEALQRTGGVELGTFEAHVSVGIVGTELKLDVDLDAPVLEAELSDAAQ